MVGLSAGANWTAAGWLFDWAMSDIARRTSDVGLAGHLNLIVDEHLGYFGLDDITPSQRREVRGIAEHLVDDADQQFPVEMARRPQVLAHLRELATMISDDANRRDSAADPRFDDFEQALRQLGPRDQNLAAVVKARLTAGQTRDEALAALASFRVHLVSAGRDEDEDVVLEVMDYVVGWASQHLKL